FAAQRLVYVELQRLRRRRVLEVEIQVVHEMRRSALRAKLLPPQRVVIRRDGHELELHAASVERRRRDVLRHRIPGHRSGAIGARAAVAAGPAGHLVDVTDQRSNAGSDWGLYATATAGCAADGDAHRGLENVP